MGSTRLPGKVLLKLDEKNTVLDFVLRQLSYCKIIDKIVVATTNLKEDDVIASLLQKNNVECFRGDSTDVLDRYYQCAKAYSFSTIIRITGDCPLIDPNIVDKIVTKFKSNDYDYISNAVTRSFPYGVDTEVFSFSALEMAWNCAKKDLEREHVTPYIYNNEDKFRILHYQNQQNLSSFRYTVDEIDDLKLVRHIVSAIQNRPILMEDVINLLTEDSTLTELNKNVKHRHIS